MASHKSMQQWMTDSPPHTADQGAWQAGKSRFGKEGPAGAQFGGLGAPQPRSNPSVYPSLRSHRSPRPARSCLPTHLPLAWLQPQRTRATSIAGDRQQLGRALAPRHAAHLYSGQRQQAAATQPLLAALALLQAAIQAHTNGLPVSMEPGGRGRGQRGVEARCRPPPPAACRCQPLPALFPRLLQVHLLDHAAAMHLAQDGLQAHLLPQADQKPLGSRRPRFCRHLLRPGGRRRHRLLLSVSVWWCGLQQAAAQKILTSPHQEMLDVVASAWTDAAPHNSRAQWLPALGHLNQLHPPPPFCLPACSFGHGFGRSLLTILSAVGVDFLGLGCLIATAGWALSNRFLRRTNQHSHAVEQSVEWCVAVGQPAACCAVWCSAGALLCLQCATRHRPGGSQMPAARSATGVDSSMQLAGTALLHTHPRHCVPVPLPLPSLLLPPPLACLLAGCTPLTCTATLSSPCSCCSTCCSWC